MQATDFFEGFRMDVEPLEAKAVIRIGIVYRKVSAARVVLSLLSSLRQEWGGTIEWRSLENTTSTMSCTDWCQHCSPGPFRADAWVLAEPGLAPEFPEEAVRVLQPLMDCPSRSRKVVLACIDWKLDTAQTRHKAWQALMEALRAAGLNTLFSDTRIGGTPEDGHPASMGRRSSASGKSQESTQKNLRFQNRSSSGAGGGPVDGVPKTDPSDMDNVLPVPHGGLNE